MRDPLGWHRRRKEKEKRDEELLDPEDVLVRELVPWVAETRHDDTDEEPHPFEQRARVAAERLGHESLRALARHIYHYFPAQSEKALYLEREERIGIWPDACREALFVILYYLGPVCLPFVRYVAFGQYDWTQINAIRVLCRFGRDGVEREQIAQELADYLLEWDWDEITCNALSALCEFAPFAPPLVEIFDRMVNGEDETAMGTPERGVRYVPWADRMTLLTALHYNAPELNRRYEPMLREIMRHKGRTPVEEVQGAIIAQERDDQEVEDETGLSSARYLNDIDKESINAAVILSFLLPRDAEAVGQLRTWRDTHPSWKARQVLADRLSKMEQDQERP